MTSPATEEAFCLEDLRRRCLGNLELMERVLAAFQASFSGDLASLTEAAHRRDAEQARRLAHRMKGAAANAAAPQLMQLAAELERDCDASSSTSPRDKVEQLQHQWKTFLVESQQKVMTCKSC